MYTMYDDSDTLPGVRAEGLAGVRVGVRVGTRVRARVGERVGVAAHSSMRDEFVMRRHTMETPSYHWNSLIIRN